MGNTKGRNRSGNFGGIGAYWHRNNDYFSMVHHQNRHRKSPGNFNRRKAMLGLFLTSSWFFMTRRVVLSFYRKHRRRFPKSESE